MSLATRSGIRLFCTAVLLLGITSITHALDLSGKWIGTNESASPYCPIPPTSTGPAKVNITQTGNTFSGTFVWWWENPSHCVPSTILEPYLLDIAGSVDENSFEAIVSFPGEGQIGTLTGSVSGNAMTFTFIIPTDEDHDSFPEEPIDTIVTAQLLRVVPEITSTVPVGSLWPPNHKMVDVGLSFSTVDHGIATTSAFIVYSDEDDGASLDASGALLLRAERAGTGDGRVYLIVITATDVFSNTTHRCHTVVVPKSQSAKDIDSVEAQAAAALAQCPSPAGYFVIGDF